MGTEGVKGTLQEGIINKAKKPTKIKKIVKKDYGLVQYSDFVRHKALKAQGKVFKKAD